MTVGSGVVLSTAVVDSFCYWSELILQLVAAPWRCVQKGKLANACHQGEHNVVSLNELAGSESIHPEKGEGRLECGLACFPTDALRPGYSSNLSCLISRYSIFASAGP